jgi:membrane protein required for colicin V production
VRVNQVDALLLVLLVPFALRGYWRGFLRESLALLGLLGGALAAAAGGGRLAAALVARHLLPPVAARAAALTLLFLAVYVGAQVAGMIADRLARVILLGGLNRVAGLAFGVAKGALVLGFVLILVQQHLSSPALAGMIAASRLGGPLTQFATELVAVGRSLAGPAAGAERA